MLLSIGKFKLYVGRSYINGGLQFIKEDNSLEIFMGKYMAVFETC